MFKKLLGSLLLIFFAALPSWAALPTLDFPASLEVHGNGLSSVAFVVSLSGISLEAEKGLRYDFSGFPAANPPSFDEESRLFFWTPTDQQIGQHVFTLEVKDPTGRAIARSVAINVLPAVPLIPLPKEWKQMKTSEKYLIGRNYFPSTNILDIEIEPGADMVLAVAAKDEADQVWRFIYLIGEERAEVDKPKMTARIWLGAKIGGQIRRDLYEDLYNYFGRVFKGFDSIALAGSYHLAQLGTYNAQALIAKVGKDKVYRPRVEIKFDESAYQNLVNSEKDPLLISDSPTIKFDVKAPSGLLWRKTRVRVDKNDYQAVNDAFDLVVVKPFKEVTSFGVNEAQFVISFDNNEKLPYGEHKIIVETLNAFGQVLTQEVYVRVVSLPTQVIGKPMIFPNPYNPNAGTEVKIQYNLTQSANIEIVVFATDGSSVMRRRFNTGDEGGGKGLNTIAWNGRSDAGQLLANGIYTGIIIGKDENRILEKFRLTIFR